MTDRELVAEKLDQAAETLDDLETDLWLTFCRETEMLGEPALPFVLGYDVVWPTMVLVTADGRTATVLGENDVAGAREMDVHNEVYAYEESLEPTFRELLRKIDPEEIAINFSTDHKTADGLSHGMYHRLRGHLEGTGYEDRLISAEEVVGTVRGVKTETERERIGQAAELTEELLAEMQTAWRPEWTERDVQSYVQERIAERGLEPSWSGDYCPTVDAGSAAPVGHTMPGDRTLPPGEVLHIDFGVRYEYYAADIQRLYYRPSEGDPDPPTELESAFGDVRAALEAGFEVLEPGVYGYEVDAAARETIVDRGRPEFNHGFGHEIGRYAHDGGTLLGPRWEPYGEAPSTTVRAGEVYSIELGVATDYGYVGLEEMVEVTPEGPEYVLEPQREFRILEPPQ